MNAPYVPLTDDASPHEWVNVVRSWAPMSDLTLNPAPAEMAVDGLIPRRKVGAIVAAGGTGKTTFKLTLGVCHATGRRFMGQRVQQGSFVLLSNDDPQEDLDEAFRRVVAAMKLSRDEEELARTKVRVHSLQGLGGTKTFSAPVDGSPAATGLEDLLVQATEGIPDLVGIGLDTLRQYSGGSTNDEQVIKIAIASATEVARRTGAYVLVAHHTGKQNYRDGITDMYCGSGSAAIADNCRFVLLLQTTTWSDVEAKVQRTGQERGDPLVLQSTRGSLLVKPTGPVFLHREGFYFGRVAGAVRSAEQILDERDRSVLRAVRAGAQSKNAIASRVGGNRKSTLARIDALELRGLLRNGCLNGSTSRPQYVLTADGSRFLEAAE